MDMAKEPKKPAKYISFAREGTQASLAWIALANPKTHENTSKAMLLDGFLHDR